MGGIAALGIGLVAGVLGYAVAASLGGWLVFRLSSNRHDRAQEAAMTGLFVLGPIAAVVATVAGTIAAWPR